MLGDVIVFVDIGVGIGGHGPDVCTRRKRFFIAGDDDATNAFVRIECGEGLTEFDHQVRAQCVQLLRAVQRDDPHFVSLGVRVDEFISHEKSHSNVINDAGNYNQGWLLECGVKLALKETNMSEKTVLYEALGTVAKLTLNRPQALNSFTRQMHHDLWAALDQAEADGQIRALVITGAGRGFCAGADLAEFDFAEGPNLVERADPGPVIDQAFNPTTRRLQQLRMPTIAAVNGVAAGAGASLVMTCDIAIAAPGASFIQAFSKIGLIPDAGSSWFLVERLGLARAMVLAMTGDKLPASQAKEWGMIWDVAEDCVSASMDMATRLAAMPTQALVATRGLLREAGVRSLNQQLDVERDTQSALGKTHDYIEGVSAFLQKRPPQFTGQ